MIYKFIVFINLLFISELYPQSIDFPDGVYLTIEQFKSLSPAYNSDLEIVPRTIEDIIMVGGNAYKLVSPTNSLSKKTIKKDVFAFVKNDTIFLNGAKLKIQYWFAMCLTKGNFLVFKGASSDENPAMMGLLGGAVGGAIVAGQEYLYVLSLRTGNARPLTKEYVIERLKDYPLLQEQFGKEEHPKSVETLIKYIELLNNLTPIDSKLPDKN